MSSRRVICEYFNVHFLYYIYDPEKGEGPNGDDSHIIYSIFVRMAYSNGLNRDHDNKNHKTIKRRPNKTKNVALFITIRHNSGGIKWYAFYN